MRFGRSLLVALALVLAASTVQARGRWGLGFYVGGPCYRPCYRPAVIIRPAPIVFAPAPVVLQPAPIVAVAAAAPESDYVPSPVPVAPPAPLAPPGPAVTVRGIRPVSDNGDLEAMNDPSPQARADSIIRLGRNKDQRAIRPLIRTLQEDGSPQVREAAARALGLIGSIEGLSALQQAAQADQERDVRKTASFAAEVIRASLRR